MRWLLAMLVALRLPAQDMAGMHMSMPMTGPLGIPMSRMGSGTSWLPDGTVMRAEHLTVRDWLFMLHYSAFVTYDHQESKRAIDGSAQINATDWIMGMVQHDLGPGRLELRAMLSSDPLTVGKVGYPLLLQSGESYRGQPLHDRQHPHDLFMEIAALYDVPVTKALGIELYGGPAGDPATGPPAFSHRPSAAGDPFAPLGHHWQDATHISYGVATAGLFTQNVKLEGSVFNGREPDETRTNFDIRTFDSYSGRLSVNPAPDWSLSTWYGYLKSPEQLSPTIAQHRMGTSVLFEHGGWSSALIWGANLYSDSPQLSNSIDLETTVDVDSRNSLFGRFEYVNKDAYDLALSPATAARRFDVGEVSIGYTRGVVRHVGLGGVVTVNDIPASLRPYYGTRTPYGFGVFLRVRP